MSNELPPGFEIDNTYTTLPEGFEIEPPHIQDQERVKQLKAPKIMSETAMRGYADNLLNAPNALGSIAGKTLAGVTAGIRSLDQTEEMQNLSNLLSGNFNLYTGQPLSLKEKFSKYNEIARNTWPASTLIGGYDAPTTFDLEAAAKSIPQSYLENIGTYGYPSASPIPQNYAVDQPLHNFGQNFEGIRDEILEGYLQRREENPVSAARGDVAGDVATMLSFRAPAVSAARAARLTRGPKPKAPKMEPGFKRWADRKIDSMADWLKDSGFKIGEAGAEAAFMAALQDEDPVTTTAVAMGAQTVGNLAEGVWKEIPDAAIKPGLMRAGAKLAIGGYAMSALYQTFKEMTPGGRDRILESEESGFKKMAAAVAVGAMTQLAGFGRPSQNQLDDLGAIVDSWHSARRGAFNSLVSEIANDDSGDLDRITAKIAQDPMYFGSTAMRRITRAQTNEDVSFKDTVESLMEADRAFRRKVFSLR